MRIVSVLYNDFAHLGDYYADAKLHVSKYASDLTSDDILLLHGGQDISPSYYDEEPNKHMASHLDKPTERDKTEWAMLQRAIELNIPIFGICRGAQLLSIAAGGKLFQHVVGHDSGKHPLRILSQSDNEPERMIWSNSCHHQQMDIRKIPALDYVLLATHPKKNTERYEGKHAMRVWGEFEDPEIVYFKKIKGFAVQGHPEWMDYRSNLVRYCLDKSKELWGLQ